MKHVDEIFDGKLISSDKLMNHSMKLAQHEIILNIGLYNGSIKLRKRYQ